MAKVVSHISPTHPLFREVMACAFSSDEQAALSMATGKALNYKLQGALEAAAANGWVPLMRLIRKQADESRIKLNGNHALHLAAEGGHDEAMLEAMPLVRAIAKIYDHLQSADKAILKTKIFSKQRGPEAAGGIAKRENIAVFDAEIARPKLNITPSINSPSEFTMALTWRIPPSHPLFQLIFVASFDEVERRALAAGAGHWVHKKELQKLLEAAAAIGWTKIVANLDVQAIKEYEVLNLENALYKAAEGGHTETMQELKERGAEEFNVALVYAAEHGQLKAMRMLKKWGANEFSWPLSYAARFGQKKAIRLLKKWGGKSIDVSLI